jgi:hypothetical protein
VASYDNYLGKGGGRIVLSNRMWSRLVAYFLKLKKIKTMLLVCQTKQQTFGKMAYETSYL